MLQASLELQLLLEQMKRLMGEPSFRYSLIVQTSDRGIDCPYAHMAQRQYLTDRVSTDEILVEMQHIIDRARMAFAEVEDEA